MLPTLIILTLAVVAIICSCATFVKYLREDVSRSLLDNQPPPSRPLPPPAIGVKVPLPGFNLCGHA